MSASAALAGIRVVDLSRLVAGNQLTMLLADFGAEVIKVERPGSGDVLRHWTTDGASIWWNVYGRNKQSVALDLTGEAGRRALRELVRSGDILVESFRPGTLERWGLGPDQLLEANPRLIIVRISGWGQTGSRADKPGFGTLVEAMSGFAAMNGFPDRAPVLPPLSLADMVAGTFGAFAALAALRAARQDGAGQVVDLSLFEPLFSILGPQAAEYAATGRTHQRSGSRSRTAAPRNIYRTRDDKWIAISASTQAMTERLLACLDLGGLLDDPRFVDNERRLEHVAALDQAIGRAIARHTLADNLDRFDADGVTAAPVCDIAGLMDSEYFSTRGVVVDGPSPGGRRLPMQAVVPRLSGTPGRIESPAPGLGEHTEKVLGPLLGSERLAALRRAGAVQ